MMPSVSGRHAMQDELKPLSLESKVDLRTAYLMMWVFALRYWNRGRQTDVMTNFITDIGPVSDGETTDPAQIHDWLSAANYVLNHPELPWGSYGDGDVGTA